MRIPAFLILLILPVFAGSDNRFVRYRGDLDQGVLETSVTDFSSADRPGVKVSLVAAVHIGDEAYFRSLNRLFRDYDAVLYELVGSREAIRYTDDSDNAVGAMQLFLRDNLGLQFQLHKIDYFAANMIHADLTAEEYSRLSEQKGENMMTFMLDAMMQQGLEGSGGSFTIADLLLIALSKDSRRQMRIITARELQNMEHLAEKLSKKNSVILHERNLRALQVLEEQLKKGRRKLAIYYGGAHMHHLMTELVSRGFKEEGRRWLPAWDMTGGQ